MIIDLKKFLFIGVQEDLTLFFERAQKEGFVEFTPLGGKKMREVPQNIHDLNHAITILRHQPVQKSSKALKPKDPVELAHRICLNQETLEKLQEERRITESEIARILPLGDFSLEQVAEIESDTGYYVQFFCVKTAKQIEVPEDLIYLTTEYDLDYYMSVSKERELFPNMIEMHIHKNLSALRRESHEMQEEIKKIESEIKTLVPYLPLLKEALIDATDLFNLSIAEEEVEGHLEGALFATQGYVPMDQLKRLEDLCEGLGIHYEEITFEEEERVPTCMVNTKTDRIGEDLVRVYDIPSREDHDPSRWVLWAFAFFFAIIISDAGYGMIYLLLSLFLKFRFRDLQGLGRRFINLMTILSISIIIWGVLTASYFGIDIPPDSPVRIYTPINYVATKKADYHLRLKDDVYQEFVEKIPALKSANSGKAFLLRGIMKKEGKLKPIVLNTFDDNILMEFALLVGMIHIILSLMRQVRRHWAGIGWAIFIAGGYFYFPHILGATTMLNYLGGVSKPLANAIGVQLLWIGITLAIFLGLVQNRLRGMGEIAKLIEIFADILSYLRLYALGLAGMVLAQTFNELGEGMGLVFGALIIIAGHIVNMTVGIMGGIIHGLRLNFIEWYHHSFEGGGKLFNPLKRLKT